MADLRLKSLHRLQVGFIDKHVFFFLNKSGTLELYLKEKVLRLAFPDADSSRLKTLSLQVLHFLERPTTTTTKINIVSKFFNKVALMLTQMAYKNCHTFQPVKFSKIVMLKPQCAEGRKK